MYERRSPRWWSVTMSVDRGGRTPAAATWPSLCIVWTSRLLPNAVGSSSKRFTTRVGGLKIAKSSHIETREHLGAQRRLTLVARVRVAIAATGWKGGLASMDAVSRAYCGRSAADRELSSLSLLPCSPARTSRPAPWCPPSRPRSTSSSTSARDPTAPGGVEEVVRVPGRVENDVIEIGPLLRPAARAAGPHAGQSASPYP